MSVLNALKDVAQGLQDAKYVADNKENILKTKGRLEEDAARASTMQKVSVAAGLAGVALAGAVVSCFASGEEKLGTSLLCADVALLIFSYNAYKASENFRSQVYENSIELMTLTAKGNPVPVNQIALRKCLLQGTLFFEPFVGLYARVVIKSLEQQQ